jgi:non-ribosomal peptide synthetase component E (peptide arylation enzyme)
VRDFLKTLGIASFKIPEQVAVFDRLPKNDAGKVLKHELRALLLRDERPAPRPSANR